MPIRMEEESRGKSAWIAWVGLLLIVLILGSGTAAWVAQQRRSSALQAAASRGDTAEVERLARLGADVNWRMGTPPLILAALRYHTDTVRVLLEHGAEVNVRNSHDGRTALEYVIGGADMRPVAAEATARVLLEHGADVTLSSPNGDSPLKWAKKVDATLKRDAQFYIDVYASTARSDLPPTAEVGQIPTARMEVSRKALVAAILEAAQQKTGQDSAGTPVTSKQ